MKNAPLRFCGYTLPHNPEKLRIDCASNICSLSFPGCPPDSVHLGCRAKVITGEGELYGADCIVLFRELCALHDSAACGLLSLPQMRPIYAFLRELSMIAGAAEDLLGYRFTFVECDPETYHVSKSRFYIVSEYGESLWDISCHTGIGIDELVALNPQIRDIDSVPTGERVSLC